MKARTIAKRINRVGRPRKLGVPRKENGRIASGFDRETEEQIKAVAMAQPHRLFAPLLSFRDAKVRPDDPLWGYALGRLLLAGLQMRGEGITDRQYEAGMRWAALHVRHCHLQGFANPNVKSPAMIMVARGIACEPEPDEAVVLGVRRDWADAYRAVMERFGAHRGRSPFEILKAVCISDHFPRPAELGTLRLALNALAHLWRDQA